MSFLHGWVIIAEMKYIDKVEIKLNEIEKKIVKKQDVLILALESSCDETSIAVVKNGREVLSNIISSQIEIHKRFGGVVPEVASRNHVLCINSVLKEALEKANVKLEDIDAVAVTYGAGLAGALMVGINFAKGLAYSLGLPLIAVNHIKGHISSNYIQFKELKPPFICLVVSGGHTAILRVDDYLNHTLIGETLDDAVGEAFDKVARVLGLGYPGGPKIDKLAKEGKNVIDFKYKSRLDKTYDVSYSGLKTAVINYLHKMETKKIPFSIEDVCASFQCQAIDVLVEKTIRASIEYGFKQIVIAGGVAANSYLRAKMTEDAGKKEIEVYYPPILLCTDNAAMIGCSGYYNLINNFGISDLSLSASPSLKLR